MSDQGDLFSSDSADRQRAERRKARAARDRALKRVLANESLAWRSEALRRVDRLPAGRYTGEDIRLKLTADGQPRPHHHNVWGGFIRSCVIGGLLRPIGEMRNMRGPRSHARKTDVYLKV